MCVYIYIFRNLPDLYFNNRSLAESMSWIPGTNSHNECDLSELPLFHAIIDFVIVCALLSKM